MLVAAVNDDIVGTTPVHSYRGEACDELVHAEVLVRHAVHLNTRAAVEKQL